MAPLAPVFCDSASGKTCISRLLGAAVVSNYLARYGDKRIAGVVYVRGVIELKADQIVPHPDIYRDLVSPQLGMHIDAVRSFLRLG